MMAFVTSPSVIDGKTLPLPKSSTFLIVVKMWTYDACLTLSIKTFPLMVNLYQ